jgi:hypothetical protein
MPKHVANFDRIEITDTVTNIRFIILWVTNRFHFIACPPSSKVYGIDGNSNFSYGK